MYQLGDTLSLTFPPAHTQCAIQVKLCEHIKMGCGLYSIAVEKDHSVHFNHVRSISCQSQVRTNYKYLHTSTSITIMFSPPTSSPYLPYLLPLPPLPPPLTSSPYLFHLPPTTSPYLLPLPPPLTSSPYLLPLPPPLTSSPYLLPLPPPLTSSPYLLPLPPPPASTYLLPLPPPVKRT